MFDSLIAGGGEFLLVSQRTLLLFYDKIALWLLVPWHGLARTRLPSHENCSNAILFFSTFVCFFRSPSGNLNGNVCF